MAGVIAGLRGGRMKWLKGRRTKNENVNRGGLTITTETFRAKNIRSKTVGEEKKWIRMLGHLSGGGEVTLRLQGEEKKIKNAKRFCLW